MNMILNQRVVFLLLMSFILSFLMSGWVTFINLGLASNLLSEWRHVFFWLGPPRR